jgi:hypothetical protein
VDELRIRVSWWQGFVTALPLRVAFEPYIVADQALAGEKRLLAWWHCGVSMVEAEHAQFPLIASGVWQERPVSSVHQDRTVMRTHRTSLALSLCIGLAVALQLSCSSEPTSNTEPSFSHGPSHFYITGPDAIGSSVRQTYTYRATMDAFYASVGGWGVRFCPVLSVTSCTVAWTSRTGTRIADNISEIYQSLVRDCTGGGTKSFQARATGTGWGVGTVTAYKSTRLCGKSTDPL